MADLLGILRIKDSNGNWVSVPGLKGDTGEPFKILGIYETAAALEAAVTDPELGDVYLVGAVGAYDIYLYLADGWHNTGGYMPKGDQGDPAPQSAITSAVETWLAANVDPETGYVLDRSLSQENAAAPADLVGVLKSALNTSVPRIAELRSEYELGTLDDNGQPATNPKTWRTKDYLPIKVLNAHYIAIPRYGRAYIYQYDNNKTYMRGKAIGWLSTYGVQIVTLDPACAFIKLVISHINGDAGNEYLANLFSMYEVNNLSVSQASPPFTVYHGTLVDGTNIFISDVADTRAHSTFIPVDKTKKAVKVTIPTSMLAYIWQFDSSFQFVREDGWIDTTWLKGLEDNTEYVVITYKDKVDGSNPVDLTVAEQTIVEFINVEKYKPNDLLGKALLWAHRGASTTAPENTLPAIELAIEQEYKAIEVDLEFTSDNVCVLLHDKTINRTSNGTGNIYDMTYAQALTYDFGSWKSAEYAGTKIPTLKEALLLCKRNNVVLQLDIADTSKTNITATNLAEMCKVIKETGMTRNVTICAYHERFRQVLSLFPAVCITFGLQNLPNAKFTDLGELSSLVAYSANKSSISTTNIDLFHNLGYMCQTWEVDTITDYDNYFDNFSVDWMITNTLTPSEVI